jgi:hypothetical protein
VAQDRGELVQRVLVALEAHVDPAHAAVPEPGVEVGGGAADRRQDGTLPLGAYDVPNLGPGGCEFTAPIETGKNLTGDLILVSNPATVAGAIQIDGRQHAVTPTALDIVFCNVGTAAFDPPLATFHWVVIDN